LEENMMRLVVASAIACAAVVAIPGPGAGAPAPAVRISFAGSAVQHVVDTKRYIADDDGTCFARELIDETAHVMWSAGASTVLGGSGSAVVGETVRDGCGGSPERAPVDWAETVACSGQLELVGPAVVTTTRTKKALVVVVAAPRVAPSMGSGCSLVVRSTELLAHVSVPLARATALKRGGSLTFAVGTARPRSGDAYAPHVDCSRSKKPYDGYKVVDTCTDDISWSGTLKLTRA